VTAHREGERPGALALTDETGFFKIENLAAVSYRVQARGPDGISSAVQENVRPGESLTLKLAEAVGLTGHVRSARGPATDYMLYIGGKCLHFARADGSYEVQGLQPGTLVAGVLSEQGFARQKVEIRAGTATADFYLDGWLSVRGRLVSSDGGRPVAGADVSLMVKEYCGCGARCSARSDSEGVFHFPELPSGEAVYMIIFSDDGKLLRGEKSHFDIRAGATELGEVKVAPP
jgi:hypothetical protein